MPTPITRYKCNHCKKHYSIKSDAVKHENRCLYNPEKKSCSTCNNCTLHDRYCDYFSKEIFVKGSPISDCSVWKEIEYDEDSGYFGD